MKRITFAIISLIAFSTISCFAEKIKGNGNIITKEIQVADYKQIKVGQGIETGGNQDQQGIHIFRYQQSGSGNHDLRKI